MSDLQHSLSVEEVTASLQKHHGLGDRLPTFADLPGLLRNESEQLELRQSRRSMRASIVNINLATSHEILRRLGDGCGVKMDRGYGTIVHPATADPLVPDLDQVQAINIGILDARRLPDDADTLQKLAKRFEAKADAQESDHGPSSASLARPTEAKPIDETASMAPADIAQQFNLSPEPLRKRLDRWRKTHHDGWIEVTERKPREPLYLYRISAVRPVIDALIASGEASGEVSGERPAKKS